MKILVAGGAGFIGSHLTDELLRRGHDVICADKLIFGDKNIRHLMDNSEMTDTGRFRFYETELASVENAERIFSENKIDAVFHLAANSDIRKGGREPDIDFNDTLLTTRSLLEGMRKYGVKNMFFASTSAVYGEMTDVRLSETTGDLSPVSYYGGAKLASEALISSYVSMCDMNAVIFRFANVCGQRLTHGVIYDFIGKLKDNPHKLTILGDGKQRKPYIYVTDLVDAILMKTEHFEKGKSVYNVGTPGDGTSVTDIADIVVDVCGLRDVEYEYTGGDRGWKGDVPRFSYDVEKIFSTGWRPRFNSDEAVRQAAVDALRRMKGENDEQ